MVSLHAELGRWFRAFYRWASTVVSLFPADIAWAYCDFEPYGS